MVVAVLGYCTRWGIYTEYMTVRSMLNNMQEMGTAYRIDRSGLREVDVLANRVYTKFHGMDLRFNDGALHVLVEGNEITFGDSQCNLCRGYSAIQVTEGNYGSPNSRIMHNTVYFVSLGASRFGINLNTADDWLVAENTLLMASNSRNETGIRMQGCNRPEVSCNTITGASATDFPLDGQAAIRNMLGSDVLISCNDVDQTANGILFNGVTPNTEVRGNFLRNHKWGLHLDGTAVIGLQELKGNLWYNAPASGGLGAWYEVSNSQAIQYQFLFNPEMISGGNTQPPSWVPPNWFDFTFGSNYECADDEGEDYCSQFNERGKERLTELDVWVANDSLENDPYTNESKWILKGRLYKKLDDNPDLLDSLQVMGVLYEELQSSSTANFKQIDDDQFALYDLDSSMVAQLQQNRAQIETLMALVKDGLEQLSDSTLAYTDLQAILDGISGYREDIHNLSIWNMTALQEASQSKFLTADGVKAANSGITTSELVEVNQKTVNDIYLEAVGKDVDGFTTEQVAALFDIANQCPMLGGNAVFKARSLYWLTDDNYDFDDASLCLPYGIVVKRLPGAEPNIVMVIPNPAMNEANLVLAQQLDEPGVFVVYDAIGAEVMWHTISGNTTRFAFSTSMLAPALYHYKVIAAGGVVGHGKLTILR